MLVENRKEPPKMLTVGDYVRVKSTGQVGQIEAISEAGIYTIRTGVGPVNETFRNLEPRQVLMG